MARHEPAANRRTRASQPARQADQAKGDGDYKAAQRQADEKKRQGEQEVARK